MTTAALATIIAAPSIDIETARSRWLGGLSASTARAYTGDVSAYFAFLASTGVHPLAATPRDTTAWLATIADLAPAARARKVAGVASFFAWAREEGMTVADPRPARSARPRVKGQDSARLVGLDAASAARLMAAADERSPRTAALVALMLTTGLRVSEAVSITPAALRTDGGGRTVLTLRGKGERVRSVVVPPLAVERLALIAPDASTAPYFVTRTGKTWSADEVRDSLARLGAAIGMPGLHPHALRHTAASLALSGGTNVEAVRAMLGHASLATTQRYVAAAGALDASPAYALAAAIAPRG